jgi:CpeT/CpcT family (DUF1001)
MVVMTNVLISIDIALPTLQLQAMWWPRLLSVGFALSVSSTLHSPCTAFSPKLARNLQSTYMELRACAQAVDHRAAVQADLLSLFQGEFDNYEQVVADRAAGLTPGPGGGHEHIHCSLQLVTSMAPPQLLQAQDGFAAPTAVIAARYYFNAQPAVTFRFRLYSFGLCASGAARGDVLMRLWRLHPDVETRLRAAGYQLQDFDWQDSAAESSSADVAESMDGCEIYWSRGSSSSTCSSSDAAAGSTEQQQPPAFVGLMGEDDAGTWISSQNTAGLDILVKDDLKLWPTKLWVNDRGYSRTGEFVYGNQRGVPYKMQRVQPGAALEWTLGAQYRTDSEYAAKMAAIGVVPGQKRPR